MATPRTSTSPTVDRPAALPAVAGKLPTLRRGSAASDAKPLLPRRDPFWLVAHPDRWTVQGGQVVPYLDEVPLTAGVNGVETAYNRETGETFIDTDGLESNLRTKGAIPIPWDVDAQPYIVEPAPGCWVTRWARPTPGSSYVEYDTDGYLAWVASLQDRGLLPRPQRRHLEQLAQATRFDLTHPNTAADKIRTAQLTAILTVLETALETA